MSFILNFWWIFLVLFLVSFVLMTKSASMAARNPSREAIREYAVFMFSRAPAACVENAMNNPSATRPDSGNQRQTQANSRGA